MLDYHLHLLRHGEDGPYRADDVRAYARQAARRGVDEIAITEHLFRFRQADVLLGGWWGSTSSEHGHGRLADQTARYWGEHATGDLDAYVEAVLAAAADPGDEPAAAICLGLEVDYYPQRMGEVAELLAGYPFDVLLGSVHWLGAWGFDQFDDPDVQAEWASRAATTRGIDAIWGTYTSAIEEMAATGTCDVLAHIDLIKVTGVIPGGDRSGWYDRLAKAAADHGLCAEISSAGLRKPVNELYPAADLLARLHAAGVGITTASDAHECSIVADATDVLRSAALAAGYAELTGFDKRRPQPRLLGGK